MHPRTPSYVVKSRHGIWYFQIWVPKSESKLGKTGQKLFRRSLKTRNRKRALQLARRMWLLIHDIGFEKVMDMKELEKAERERDYNEWKFRKGRKIAEELKKAGITENHIEALNAHFDAGPWQEEECYHYYMDAMARGDLANAAANSPVVTQPHKSPKSESPLLHELLNEWQKIIQGEIRKSSYTEYERSTNIFLQVLTEHSKKSSIRLFDISIEMIRDFKEVIKYLPKRVITKNRKVNFHELAGSKNITRSYKTINDQIGHVNTFFNWLKGEGYHKSFNEQVCSLSDICDVLSSPIKGNEKNGPPIVPFSHDDLEKLFLSERYRLGKFNRAVDYWVPLIALFTGARQSEIVQLNVRDIKEDSGVMVFDFNEDDGHLKTIQSRRLVPIHSQLKSLEFLEFIDSQRERGFERVFPEEKRDTKDLYGNYGKRFNTFRNSVGVDVGADKGSCRKVFHSFRHLVRTKLKIAEVESGLIDAIIGHASKERSIGEKTYTHTQLVKVKNREMGKLKYDLDFSQIARWKRCPFARRFKTR